MQVVPFNGFHNKHKATEMTVGEWRYTYCLWWCSSSYFYLEKYLSSQAGLEPTTIWSLVRRSNHWAIRTQMAERKLYFDVGHFHC